MACAGGRRSRDSGPTRPLDQAHLVPSSLARLSLFELTVNGSCSPAAKVSSINLIPLVVIEVARQWRKQTLANARVTRRPSLNLMPDDLVEAASRSGIRNIESHSRGVLGS